LIFPIFASNQLTMNLLPFVSGDFIDHRIEVEFEENSSILSGAGKNKSIATILDTSGGRFKPGTKVLLDLRNPRVGLEDYQGKNIAYESMIMAVFENDA